MCAYICVPLCRRVRAFLRTGPAKDKIHKPISNGTQNDNSRSQAENSFHVLATTIHKEERTISRTTTYSMKDATIFRESGSCDGILYRLSSLLTLA